MGKSGYCKISRLRGLDIAKYYFRKVYDILLTDGDNQYGYSNRQYFYKSDIFSSRIGILVSILGGIQFKFNIIILEQVYKF